jgi:hypothetical protein
MSVVKSFIYFCLYANAKGKLRVERMNDQVQTNTILNKCIKCGIFAKREVFFKTIKHP